MEERAPHQHWSCNIPAPVARQQCQGPPGTLLMAMWEPCPASKSTSVCCLKRMVVPCMGGGSQLRNFCLQSSCQWKMESHGEETRNRRKRGEKTGPRDGAVPYQHGRGEKGSWGTMGKGLQKPPTGPQTPDLCTLGSYDQDISLEGIPELLLSTKFVTSVTTVGTHHNATAGNKRTMWGECQRLKERCRFVIHKDPGRGAGHMTIALDVLSP